MLTSVDTYPGTSLEMAAPRFTASRSTARATRWAGSSSVSTAYTTASSTSAW